MPIPPEMPPEMQQEVFELEQRRKALDDVFKQIPIED